MGAAASLASGYTGCKTAGTKREQQQKPRKQHQQQQDWASALGLVVAHTSEADDIGVAQCHTERNLHRVNKQLRAAACATISHLSLWRYQKSRNSAQQAWQDTDTFSAALAAAAAVPPIPRALLSATPCLTSLDLEGSQAAQLTAGGSVTGASEVQGGTSQVLAATLARLQSLQVWSIGSEAELRHVGWLLGHCPHLTKLVLDGSPDMAGDAWCEGLDAGTAAAAAAAADMAAGEAGSMPLSRQLPALQHLVLSNGCAGLVNALLYLPGVASQLTALQLSGVVSPATAEYHNCDPTDWSAVADCSGLRELVLSFCRYADAEDVPEELTQLTALTKLVLREVNFKEVSAVVCSLKQLRVLDMSLCRPLEDIPSSISQLQQLQQLNLFRTKVQQLPEELGTWLPQLRVLEARRTEFPTIPHSLSRLTCLVADDSCVTELSAVEHLVALKCLHLESISPPLQALSRLVALETLCLGLWCRLSEQEAAAVCIPGPLPNLRSLTVEAETGIPAGGLQVLVGAEQLTHLRVEVHAESGQENDQLAALWETGVLPQLQQLVIMCDGGEYPPVLQAAAAIPWLEQQPQLTSLRISGCLLKALELEQLPCQLEALDFRCCKLADDDPGVLTHLTRLHTLKLPVAGEVPQWLEYLKRLEELHVWTRWFVDGVQLTGWEVLAQLPLLRRGKGLQEAFPYAPHLCWSAECYSDSDED